MVTDDELGDVRWNERVPGFANGEKRKGIYAFGGTVCGPGVMDGLLHENIINRFVCDCPLRIHSKARETVFGM